MSESSDHQDTPPEQPGENSDPAPAETSFLERPSGGRDPDERFPTSLVRPTALQLYLARIREVPLLSPEEEHALARKYCEEGDREAAYRLVTANLRLVFKIALNFQRAWMNNLLDLVQEGNVGLMQAVRKFDPYRGTRLSSYASYWIKAYILKFILDNWRLVKIGKTQAERKLFFNLYKERDRLSRLGFDPGPKLIAQNLNVREDEVIKMDQRLGSWEISLEKPVKDEPASQSLRDLLPAPVEPMDEQLGDRQIRSLVQKKLEKFRKTLKGREREIFEERLMSSDPVTLQELGNRYRITKERTRQLESRLLEKLHQFLVREIPDAEEVIPDFLANLPS